MYRIFQVVVAAAAMACCSTVMAQGCGCGLGLFGDANYAQQDNCGRGISQTEAEGLWANYCNETCGFGGGCDSGCGGKFGSRLRGRFAGGGCCAGGNACGTGGFGYPAGDACGSCGGRGGLLAGRGCGGCKLGGKLKGLMAGRGCSDNCGSTVAFVDNQVDQGCGCDAPAASGCGCRLGGKLKGMFAGGGLSSRSGCGCGIRGRLFRTPMGADAGCGCDAPMQSCVAGCATSAVLPMAAPNSAQPVVNQQMETNIVGEAQPAEAPVAEAPLEAGNEH